MPQPQADQLRQDLETLRNVVGAELPFDRVDVRCTAAIGAAILLPGLLGLVGVESRPLLLGSAIPFVAILFAWMIRNWRAAHPSLHCSVAKRRESRTGLGMNLLLVPIILGYGYWARSLGTPPAVVNGTTMMFLGWLVATAFVYDRQRYASLCVAIPAMLGGLLWPYLDRLQLFTALCLLVAVGMLVAATLMQRQLQQQAN